MVFHKKWITLHLGEVFRCMGNTSTSVTSGHTNYCYGTKDVVREISRSRYDLHCLSTASCKSEVNFSSRQRHLSVKKKFPSRQRHLSVKLCTNKSGKFETSNPYPYRETSGKRKRNISLYFIYSLFQHFPK